MQHANGHAETVKHGNGNGNGNGNGESGNLLITYQKH